MRWYLTEAPSAHFAQTHQSPNLKQKRQDATGESQREPEGLSARADSHEGCVVLQSGAALSASQQQINGKWVPWNTGTQLRVLLSSLLLCVYFVLFRVGY